MTQATFLYRGSNKTMDLFMLHESKSYVLIKYICNIEHSDSCTIERLHQLIDDGVRTCISHPRQLLQSSGFQCHVIVDSEAPQNQNKVHSELMD